MAYIQKRGNSWQAQISWYDLQNKRRYKTKSGFLTKAAAKKWANEMEVAKQDSQISDQDPIFADYFKSWYEAYKTPGKSNSTKRRYKKFISNYKKNLVKPKYLTLRDFYTKIL